MNRLIKICCVVLSAIMCISLPSCGEDDGTLRIGVYGLTKDLSPFSETDFSGDTIKDMLYSRLISRSVDGGAVWGEDENCAALDVALYRADKSFAETADGGFTAVKITLKNNMLFSNSASLTSEDAAFSLYAATDPATGHLTYSDFPLAGLYDYTVGKTGAFDLSASAEKAVENGFETEVFTDSEIATLKECIQSAGEEFSSEIRSYVTENYLTNDSAEIYIFDGISPDEVKNSESLSTAFAMKLWNYGDFVYEYKADSNGTLVGVQNQNGGYTYKTTLGNALENEMYVTYQPDGDGEYAYDYMAQSYYLDTDNTAYVHYSKTLSDKYTVISKTALVGFRDTEGVFYSLDGNGPDSADFFGVMSRSYTRDGITDYRKLENSEGFGTSSGFFSSALADFAEKVCNGEAPNGISGIKTGKTEIDGTSFETLTLLFDGNIGNAAELCTNIYIVSKKAYLEGFATDKNPSPAGFPTGDAEFARHVKKAIENPIGSGPYTLSEINDGEIVLSANQMFFSMGKGLHVPYTKTIEAKDITSSGATKQISGANVHVVLSESDMKTINKLKKRNNVTADFIPDFSYEYVVINPSYYINIRTRTAIISLLDTSLALSDGGEAINYSMPTPYGFEKEDAESLYDPSLTVAWDNFAMSGYTVNENGIMTEPKTGQQAKFTFTLMPSEEGGAVHSMFKKACEHLKELGAVGEIVFDADLLYNIYSDRGVAIYALSWNLEGTDGALCERYSPKRGTDATRANGVESLFSGGQIDNYGTVVCNGETLNQSDALDKLDSLIEGADNALLASEKASLRAEALDLIRKLRFELPVRQNGSYALIRNDKVNIETFNSASSSLNPKTAHIWDVMLISYEEQSISQDSAIPQDTVVNDPTETEISDNTQTDTEDTDTLQSAE